MASAKPRLGLGRVDGPAIAGVPVRSAQRVTSGAFTQISQTQINQIKESFTMLDNDRDGVISREDLEQMLTSLGQMPSSQTLDSMMSTLGSPLQFPVYLTAMSSILAQFASREELVNAFSAFDDDDNGAADVEELREALVGSGLKAEEVDACFKPFVRYTMGRERLLYKELAESIII
ncbi:uncharacterized protein V2V93DRAFT_367220 [Kockiozyma suomiensis]|uniref:uncharacterized protein n=1 Tax=Kockiozyma suomiensis TaxID=1337062 RepID=UPI003342E8DF